MKIKTIVVGLAVLGAIGIWGACASQPPLPCVVERSSSGSNWAAVYNVHDPSQADGGNLCYMTGDTLGMEKFNPSTIPAVFADSGAPVPGTGTQNANVAQLAIGTENLGLIFSPNGVGPGGVDTNPAHVWYSLGDFPANPDTTGFCTSKTMSVAEQDLPAAFFAGPPPSSEQDFSYAWSNVQVASVTAAPGTMFQAQLTIKERVSGCSTDYDVWGVFPSVGCQAVLEDDAGVPIGGSLCQDANGNSVLCTDPTSTGIPALDQAQCSGSVANTVTNLTSGINPDFPVKCALIGGPGGTGQLQVAAGISGAPFSATCVLTKAPSDILKTLK